MWFPRRTAEVSVDAYASEFDAVVWRVTHDGQSRAYDSMHACGYYQYFFPMNARLKATVDDWWQEPVLVPQVNVPKEYVVPRLQAGTHYLRRVLPESKARDAGRAGSYKMLSYHALRSLPIAKGVNQSLFSADGLLDGSERLERFWL